MIGIGWEQADPGLAAGHRPNAKPGPLWAGRSRCRRKNQAPRFAACLQNDLIGAPSVLFHRAHVA